MSDPRRILKSSLAAAALVAAFFVISSQSAAASAEPKGPCNTAAQSISDRVGVSCKKAKKVARKATRRLGLLPECGNDAAVTFKGWEISAGGQSGSVIATIFIKGNKSFIISGGGAC